ncbi:MAG: M23 family metallopeptidase, partial [Elusimicrobia bacterium]|nr:M23 family metallopeptidase [Elusimicrobiota bacterium]
GILLAGREKVALRQRLMGIQGKIKTSLWEAMMEQGVPPDVIYRFAEVFAWKIDFLTEPRRGDTYKMVWVRRSAEGAVLDGDVLCAQYHGWETGRVFAFRMGDEYYDMEGRSLRGEFLRAPLSYRRISSYFSNRRFHPILRYYRPHHGVDYAAAYGTPVVSVGAGKVIAVGWDKGLGRAVRVRHLNGYVSIYGHLSGYSGKIKVGSNIQQGQLVGTVGSSGLSSGPHLHLGFEKDGQMVNFLRLRLKPGRTVVAQKDRENFNRIKRESYTLLAQIFRHSSQPESLESPFFLTQLNNSSDALKVR